MHFLLNPGTQKSLYTSLKSEILGKMDQKTNFFNVIRDLHPQAHFVEQQVCLLCSSWFLCQQRDREEKLRSESSSFRPLGKSDEETWRRNIPIKRTQWTMSLIVGTRKSNPILGVLKILLLTKLIQVRIFLPLFLENIVGLGLRKYSSHIPNEN